MYVRLCSPNSSTFDRDVYFRLAKCFFRRAFLLPCSTLDNLRLVGTEKEALSYENEAEKEAASVGACVVVG
jgi:hypothetical protein